MAGVDRAAALTALLDEQATALRAGRVDALPALADRMAALVAGGLAGTDPATARRLRDRVARNASLAQAAEKGLRAARRRLADVAGAARGGRTYDGQGQIGTVGPSATSLVRRA
ncbi:MAG TPA: hypothetical protein VLA78_12940 [Paracoccaceae bacterium]|nr:hypothetical protein [Paracoccaceae bacterium]